MNLDQIPLPALDFVVSAAFSRRWGVLQIMGSPDSACFERASLRIRHHGAAAV